MADDAKERHDVHSELTEKLSPRTAAFVMERLPPVAWDELATKADLADLADRIDLKLDLKLDSLKHELGEKFEKRLNDAVSGRTRTIVVGQVGAVVATAIAVITAAQLG